MSDAVESPQHYTQGYIESIYAIKQILGNEGFKAFCMGNFLKYKQRADYKNGEEDLKKAAIYLDWAVNGLPAPVNNMVPKKDRAPVEPKLSGSISAVLQHELDILAPNVWCVDAVQVFPLSDGWRRISAVISYAQANNNPDKFELRPVLQRVHEGARYAEIVFDLIEEAKKIHRDGPWKA
ncbi:MAG TPA: DUF3310 domain-containing protein [Candidatus Acidoferrales bacterium]|nr:DUF3310 domain-containing protein [Candidatus Acidoferrales bacterium]